MNSTQIKCFISVGQTHNFSKTAKDLFLTQPSVSKNIHNLEKELSTKLVINRNRTITFTPAGQYFYGQIKKIDTQVTEIIKNTKSRQERVEKTITIGYSGIPFEQKYLPIFIETISHKHKWHINLQRISFSKTNVNEQLDNSNIDFMLYQSDFFKGLKYGFFPIFNAGFSVIVRKDDTLRKEDKISITKLKNRKIYLWNGRTPLDSVSKLKNKLIKELDIKSTDIHIINQASLAKIIVLSRTGVAIVPSLVYDYEDKDIYYKLLDYERTNTYGIGYLKSKKEEPYFDDITHQISTSTNLIREKWD